MALLKVDGLGVNFKGRYRIFKGRGDGTWALKSLSFAMEETCGASPHSSPKGQGATLSVIGESGSGKTTLLRALLGLIRPTVGTVELWGRDLGTMNDAERLAVRRRCGYVPQDPYGSLPPSLTVLETVLEPWRVVKGEGVRSEGMARAKELLVELKLPEEFWGARVRYSLSGGQRQRVAVARALILEPNLLLCDEPTAMQDVSTRGDVLEVLNRRIKAGMSMILVTHDLLLARYATERGIVLRYGEMVESGRTREFLENPSHDYTRALLAALPRLPD